MWRSREIAYIAISAALWSVLNVLISPVFFALTKLPFICDMLGIAALALVSWRIRRFGAATSVGFIATVLTLSMNPMMVQFIGFGISSVVFDVLAYLIGYRRMFESYKGILVSIPAICMAFSSGLIIAVAFMGFTTAQLVISWGALHAAGGIIGTAISVMIIAALSKHFRHNATLKA